MRAIRLLAGSQGGAAASPLTTKGDLHGYSNADARIPVGADGTVLTADSAQALGLKWAGPITSGTLAARGAAGVAGRAYWATDVLNGALFYDNGVAWKLVGPSVAVNLADDANPPANTFTGNGQAANTDVTLWTPWTIPANFLTVGAQFKFALFTDSDLINSATARNLIFKLKVGAVTVWTLTVAALASASFSDNGGGFEGILVCTAIGAAGHMRSGGIAVIPQASTLVNLEKQPSSGAGPVTGIDTTSNLAVTFTLAESVNLVADVVRPIAGEFMLTRV